MRQDLEAAIDAHARQYRERAAADQAKLQRMMLYGQIAGCRWKFLHEYFDEPFKMNRGHCDNCAHPMEEQLRDAASRPQKLPSTAVQQAS